MDLLFVHGSQAQPFLNKFFIILDFVNDSHHIIYLNFLFPVKAKWFVLGLGVISIFSGFSGTQSNVAHFAHLGGMFFGFIVMQYWRGKLPIKPEQKMIF